MLFSTSMSAARHSAGASEIRRRRTPNRKRVASIKRGGALDVTLNEFSGSDADHKVQIAAYLETSRPHVSRIEHADDVRLTIL
jgi:hypothetical protein